MLLANHFRLGTKNMNSISNVIEFYLSFTYLFLMSEQISRRRIPSDAHLTKCWLLQIAGQDPKDSYLTVYCTDSLFKAQELYYKWPEMAGCRIRIINHNGRVYKRFMKWFKWDYCGMYKDSCTTYHFEKNYENIYQTITFSFGLTASAIFSTNLLNKLFFVASFAIVTNEASIVWFLLSIRSKPSVRPKLKVIKGGV